MAIDPPPIQQPALEGRTIDRGGIFTRQWILWFNLLRDSIQQAGSFIGLIDTPSNYTGDAGLFLRVNGGETGVEFSTASLSDLSDVDTTGSVLNDRHRSNLVTDHDRADH